RRPPVSQVSQAASPVPEQMAVRWAARGGALVLAAIAALVFLHPFPVAMPGQRGDGAGVVSISIEMPQSVQRTQEPEHPPPQTPVLAADARCAAPSLRGGARGEMCQLWSYSAGRFVFPTADQFQRCRAAPARGSEAADCPPPSDRHEMILAETNTSAPPL